MGNSRKSNHTWPMNITKDAQTEQWSRKCKVKQSGNIFSQPLDWNTF